jgi:hypothetical protein
MEYDKNEMNCSVDLNNSTKNRDNFNQADMSEAESKVVNQSALNETENIHRLKYFLKAFQTEFSDLKVISNKCEREGKEEMIHNNNNNNNNDDDDDHDVSDFDKTEEGSSDFEYESNDEDEDDNEMIIVDELNQNITPAVTESQHVIKRFSHGTVSIKENTGTKTLLKFKIILINQPPMSSSIILNSDELISSQMMVQIVVEGANQRVDHEIKNAFNSFVDRLEQDLCRKNRW